MSTAHKKKLEVKKWLIHSLLIREFVKVKKRKLRNKAYKSKMRTVVKKFYSAIEANDVEVAKTAYSDAVKVIAKVGQKRRDSLKSGIQKNFKTYSQTELSFCLIS